MWRERIIEAKTAQGISTKTMAERMQTTEKTVKRLLTDNSKSPYITTVLDAGLAVGLSPQEIFAETGLFIGNNTHAELQADLDRLTTESVKLQDEITDLKDTINKLNAENDMLRLKLEHKEEIIAVHNYYIKKATI